MSKHPISYQDILERLKDRDDPKLVTPGQAEPQPPLSPTQVPAFNDDISGFYSILNSFRSGELVTDSEMKSGLRP